MTRTDFFYVTIIDKHLLAHVSLQRTPLTRAGGRVEVVASLSQGRTTAAQCGLFTHKSVPVVFEPPCTIFSYKEHFGGITEICIIHKYQL